MYERSVEDPDGFWREIAVADYHWQARTSWVHHAATLPIPAAGVRCAAIAGLLEGGGFWREIALDDCHWQAGAGDGATRRV